jgi:hypothetical protein
MKKEIQSSKNTRTMATKTIPKRIQSLLSALTDFVVGISGDISPLDNESDIRKLMLEHQEELLKLLKSNMPVQKAAPLKKEKDPDAPKRGKSSYIYFCVDKRETIKEANPDMSATNIIKELGRVWREDTSDKDKAEYAKLSLNDKNRYDNEMKEYTPPPYVGNVIEKKGKTKRVGPKRGLTAYIFFCKESRTSLKEKNPELSTKAITTELGRRWRGLSDKDRKPFDKLAAVDKARYEKEKISWVDPDDNVTVKSKSTVSKKSSTKKGRRKSGYILFCQEERPNVKELNDEWTGQEVTKELSRVWKKLSNEEQTEYNARAVELTDEPVHVKTTKKSKAKAPEADDESDIEELVDEDSE